MTTEKELISLIHKAFGSTTYPGDANIVPKTQYDDEVAECEAKFKGKKWQEVDWHSIQDEGWASGCAFLTNEAYRYYLPAYMIAILERPNEMFDAIDPVVRSLTVPEVSDYTDMKETLKAYPSAHEFLDHRIKDINAIVSQFHERVDGFNDEQQQIIRQFLKRLYELLPDEFFHNEPLVAIDRYWKKF